MNKYILINLFFINCTISMLLLTSCVSRVWIDDLENSDNPINQLYAASYYLKGTVPEDINYEKGLILLEKSAAQGEPYAQTWLGMIYYGGLYGVTKDFNRAYQLFSDAAQKGNIDAKAFLGQQYFLGEGVEKDYKKALQYTQEALTGNQILALNTMGLMYLSGKGVPLDYEKAFTCINMSAQQKDNAAAQYNLSILYKKGWGTEKDIDKSIFWLEKAADNGHIWAQYELGKLYLQGDDVPQDINHAKKYLEMAAEQKYQPAIDTLIELKAR